MFCKQLFRDITAKPENQETWARAIHLRKVNEDLSFHLVLGSDLISFLFSMFFNLPLETYIDMFNSNFEPLILGANLWVREAHLANLHLLTIALKFDCHFRCYLVM